MPIILPRGPLRILIAPDAFKGSLDAATAADAIAAGARQALPDADVRLLPLADGGDGTVDALLRAGYARRTAPARGPTGRPGRAAYASRSGRIVVELAAACGLARLPHGRLDPLGASTLGLGDVIRHALDENPRELVIGLGGSASTDGGAGMLVALGARVTDDAGNDVRPDGRHLVDIRSVDLDGLDARLRHVRALVATDVTSPLLGSSGSAMAFGPQKGATPDQVQLLEAGLAHWADVLADASGVDARSEPGSGAAGGTGLAAIAALRGEVVQGGRFVQEAAGLEAALEWCDLVVTGEGTLDRTTLQGKGVGSLAAAARAHAVPVVAVCGRVDLDAAERADAGIADAIGLVEVAAKDADPVRDPVPWLVSATDRLIRRISAGS